MKELAEIFGGREKILVMRHFIRNPGSSFTSRDLTEKLDVDGRYLRSVLALLERAGFLSVVAERRSAKKGRRRVQPEKKWKLNKSSSFLPGLQTLLSPLSVISDQDLLRELEGVGKVKVLILSGVFVGNRDEERSLDLLLVGDKIKEDRAASVIAKFERDIGAMGSSKRSSLGLIDSSGTHSLLPISLIHKALFAGLP
jgi:hypothetical protein